MPGKDDSKGTRSVIYVTISIVQYKKGDIIEQREKTDNEGIVEVRTHSKKESTSMDGKVTKKETWKTTEYRIPLFKLGLTAEASKSDILKVLNDPAHITNKAVSEILKKLRDDYDGIKPSNFSQKYFFKTERFKKRRDFTPKKKVMMG
ncbi:MAG: hypothetical protein JW839_03305 [Candidatus Lokiarchaeota archaeon]|nr:hypothetical protein [Candidatus Lokiarchaeota archaeon]